MASVFLAVRRTSLKLFQRPRRRVKGRPWGRQRSHLAVPRSKVTLGLGATSRSPPKGRRLWLLLVMKSFWTPCATVCLTECLIVSLSLSMSPWASVSHCGPHCLFKAHFVTLSLTVSLWVSLNMSLWALLRHWASVCHCEPHCVTLSLTVSH